MSKGRLSVGYYHALLSVSHGQQPFLSFQKSSVCDPLSSSPIK